MDLPRRAAPQDAVRPPAARRITICWPGAASRRTPRGSKKARANTSAASPTAASRQYVEPQAIVVVEAGDHLAERARRATAHRRAGTAPAGNRPAGTPAAARPTTRDCRRSARSPCPPNAPYSAASDDLDSRRSAPWSRASAPSTMPAQVRRALDMPQQPHRRAQRDGGQRLGDHRAELRAWRAGGALVNPVRRIAPSAYRTYSVTRSCHTLRDRARVSGRASAIAGSGCDSTQKSPAAEAGLRRRCSRSRAGRANSSARRLVAAGREPCTTADRRCGTAHRHAEHVPIGQRRRKVMQTPSMRAERWRTTP